MEGRLRFLQWLKMTRRSRILTRHYSDRKPFVTIKIAIINLQTSQQVTFEQRCWVDTGFAGGIHVPEFRMSDARTVGVQPKPTPIMLAGGVRRTGYARLSFLQQIDGYDIPPPGLETELVMQGKERHGLIGLEILKNWVVKFNGPKEILTIYKDL